MKISVCMICLRPNPIWLEFLQSFVNYPVYVIIDDNTENYQTKYSEYDKIHFIQIKNEDCKNKGFMNSNYVLRKLISGWDKALYYFSIVNTTYDHVWFLEDDVFFYNEETLSNIDTKYKDYDLLSTDHGVSVNGIGWHFQIGPVHVNYPLPYFYGMICAVRMSRELMSKIKEYVTKHNTLFFVEAMFPTVCRKHDLTYHHPEELKNIVFRKNYKIHDIDKINLYHPVKNMETQKSFRDNLSKQPV